MLRGRHAQQGAASLGTRHRPLTRWCGAGFEVADAIALLRLDDLYIECFEIKDVKARCMAVCLPCPSLCCPAATEWMTVHARAGGPQLRACWGWWADAPGDWFTPVQTLRGEHLSRCIGRLAGKVSLAPCPPALAHVFELLISTELMGSHLNPLGFIWFNGKRC